MTLRTQPNYLETLTELTAICPVDGRYGQRTSQFRGLFSEYGLMKKRLLIEVLWLCHIAKSKKILNSKTISKKTESEIIAIYDNFNLDEARKVKDWEATTNHDVKAVEYYMKDKMISREPLRKLIPFIHFGCTSEDINNLAYTCILKESLENHVTQDLQKIIDVLRENSGFHANAVMLSRTHGQAASPTTMGKEIANFCFRLETQLTNLKQIKLVGKLNGAVGNYNALVVAYPNIDWPKLTEKFINTLDLEISVYTTQIEPHDHLAQCCNQLTVINSILIDLCKDIWSYISIGYFSQKVSKNETGSSTMPHKVNPIDFENAEGNLGMSNAILKHFSEKLTISRLQRDLSDSTVMRNLGLAMSYHYLAVMSTLKGLDKLQINSTKMIKDLDENWQVLAEPIQTVMRSHGIDDAYEQLKDFSRGKEVSREILHDFLDKTALPKSKIKELKRLTPQSYIGLAPILGKNV